MRIIIMNKNKKSSNYYITIKQARVDQNISQQFLADEIGVSRQAISQFENGLCSLSSTTIRKMEILFGISEVLIKNRSASINNVKNFLFSFSMLLLVFLSLAFFLFFK